MNVRKSCLKQGLRSYPASLFPHMYVFMTTLILSIIGLKAFSSRVDLAVNVATGMFRKRKYVERRYDLFYKGIRACRLRAEVC